MTEFIQLGGFLNNQKLPMYKLQLSNCINCAFSMHQKCFRPYMNWN